VGIGTLAAGAIGVSNVMLVIVRERTREIGVRRAIGATPSAITSQIVLEAVVLTLAAGYLGLVAGVAVMTGVDAALDRFGTGAQMFTNPEVSLVNAFQALALLVAAGAAAGLIPARRAVAISPVQALRGDA
jgi:putative ABC transport system permease protein